MSGLLFFWCFRDPEDFEMPFWECLGGCEVREDNINSMPPLMHPPVRLPTYIVISPPSPRPAPTTKLLVPTKLLGAAAAHTPHLLPFMTVTQQHEAVAWSLHCHKGPHAVERTLNAKSLLHIHTFRKGMCKTAKNCSSLVSVSLSHHHIPHHKPDQKNYHDQFLIFSHISRPPKKCFIAHSELLGFIRSSIILISLSSLLIP